MDNHSDNNGQESKPDKILSTDSEVCWQRKLLKINAHNGSEGMGFDPHPLANGTPGWKDARGRVGGLKEKLLGCQRRVKD
jgi:hypothetical protein